MSDYDPSNRDEPISSEQTPNAYIPRLWHRRAEERWKAGVAAMASNWPTAPPPYHEALLGNCRSLIAEGDERKYQLAVVLAQAACEVLTEQLVTGLVERVKPESLRSWIDKRVGKKHRNDLDERRVRDLYLALTGDEIKMGEGFWQQYHDHVKRRHLVVHKGATVSKSEAEHSYNSVQKVIEYLKEVQSRLG
jgi:hypothetical protein